MGDDLFQCPAVTDEDILWASRLLGLPTNAFTGPDGNDPRQEVLKSMAPMDIAACPGSGKTTLLVAKLAILGKKWQYRTRGICVLSHTNAARREIETRLGNTSPGRRLLSYPHFIGTIHAFVNEYMALPWLRSRGHHAVHFSTEISGNKLWRLSKAGAIILGYLRRNFSDPVGWENALRGAHYVGPARDLCLRSGRACKVLRRHASSTAFRHLDRWKSSILEDGYAAYDDTFAYGRCSLQKCPWLVGTLRDRFPVVFIDEAQDNSEEQSAILHHVFMGGDEAVVRQRLGDPNQAIYDFPDAEGAVTDTFPDANRTDLPNSHRFGQTIADFADPLGLAPYALKGHGPQKPFASGTLDAQHTVFLFDDDGIDKTLDAYADLLADTFSEQELREGTFTAVGQVHSPTGDDHKPRHLAHYLPNYDSRLTRADPKPGTLAGYILAGQGRAEAIGEAWAAVEKIAEGILRLAGMASGGKRPTRRPHGHRQILALLEQCAHIRARYEDMVSVFASRKEAITKETWDSKWCAIAREVAEAVSNGSLAGGEADEFLRWQDSDTAPSACASARKGLDNIYRQSRNGKTVAIRVGSIHSVKGETHTATLVLETYWHTHNLESLLPWLYGSQRGKVSTRVWEESRLKVHYVAMTRPTHLLCLAMRQGTAECNDGVIQKLKEHGWAIRRVGC